MRITKDRRPGELISVDLLKPSPLTQDGWVTPINFETSTPPTVYARVAHGKFAVRVMTTSDAELMIHIDGRKVLEKSVSKGIHVFDRDAAGKIFSYGEGPEASNSESTEPVSEQGTLFEIDTPPVADAVESFGQVAVHVRFADVQDGMPRPSVTPDFPVPVFFQMNPPGAHEETMASLLSKVKRPAKLTAEHDISGEAGAASSYPERICCNCPNHDHDHSH